MIPKLNLNNVESGGGWALGERFSILPPGHEQKTHKIFSVGGVAVAGGATSLGGLGGVRHESDDELSHHEPSPPNQTAPPQAAAAASQPAAPPQPSAVHTSQYSLQPEDDDDTFVDHGAAGNEHAAPPPPQHLEPRRVQPPGPQVAASGGSSAAQPAAGGNRSAHATPQKNPTGTPLQSAMQAAPSASPPVKPLTTVPPISFNNAPQQQQPQGHQQQKPNPAQPPNRDDEEDDDGRFPAGSVVSRMQLPQPVRSMTVVDGKYLWAAVGDDPLTMFVLEGSELTQARSVANITNVRAVALIHVPPAKAAPVSYKFSAAAARPVTQQQQQLSRQSSKNDEIAAPDAGSRVLWCGVDKGSIVVLDLFFYSDDGVIQNAHTDGIAGIWGVGNNGRVWTCGREKCLKVWDAATRKNLSKRQLTACITDLCFVPSTGHVWTTCHDTYLRIYDVDSKEVKLPRSSSFQHNVLAMRSDVRTVKHHAASQTVWVCLERQLLVYHPKTFEPLGSMSMSATCLEFCGANGSVAVLVAHGDGIDTVDRLLLVDATDVRQLSIIAIGAPIEGVSVVGLRCFGSASPFGVIPHMDGKSRCISVYTTSDTELVGNWSCGIGALGRRHLASAGGAAEDDSSNSYADQHPPISNNNSTLPPGTSFQLELQQQTQQQQTSNTGKNTGSNFKLYETSTTTEETTRIDRINDYDDHPSTLSRDTFETNTRRGGAGGGGSGTGGGGQQQQYNSQQQQQGIIDPAVSLNIGAILRETTDMSRSLKQIRVSLPAQEDFGKLYAQLLHAQASIASLSPATAAVASSTAPPSPERGGQSSSPLGDFCTNEGRIMGAIIQRLIAIASQPPPLQQQQLGECGSVVAGGTAGGAALATAGNAAGSPSLSRLNNGSFRQQGNGGEDRRAASINTSSGSATVDLDCTTNTAQMNNASPSVFVDPSVPVFPVPALSAQLQFDAIVKMMGQAAKVGQVERQQHLDQISAMQSHTLRIGARHEACIVGYSNVCAVLGDHAAAAGKELPSLTTLSSPQEVSSAFKLLTAVARKKTFLQQTPVRHGDHNSSWVDSEGDDDDDRTATAQPPLSTLSLDQPPSATVALTAAATTVAYDAPSTWNQRRRRFLFQGLVQDLDNMVVSFGRSQSLPKELSTVRPLVALSYYEHVNVDLDLAHDYGQSLSAVDLHIAETMCRLCSNEVTVLVMERILAELADQEEQQEQRGGAGEGGVASAAFPGVDEDKLSGPLLPKIEGVLSRLTNVSMELDSSAVMMRRAFGELITQSSSTEVGVGGGSVLISAARARAPRGFDAIGSQLAYRRSRLFGLLYWRSVWLRLLCECAEELDQLLSDATPQRIHEENGVMMFAKLTDAKDFLHRMSVETLELGQAIKAASLIAHGQTSPSDGDYFSMMTSSSPSSSEPSFMGRMLSLYLTLAAKNPDVTPALLNAQSSDGMNHSNNNRGAGAGSGLLGSTASLGQSFGKLSSTAQGGLAINASGSTTQAGVTGSSVGSSLVAAADDPKDVDSSRDDFPSMLDEVAEALEVLMLKVNKLTGVVNTLLGDFSNLLKNLSVSDEEGAAAGGGTGGVVASTASSGILIRNRNIPVVEPFFKKFCMELR